MSELAKLFIKYCPIFYFYKDEPYMPCDFEDILNIANKCNSENMNREKILIESLIDIKQIETTLTINDYSDEDSLITSINNILDYYLTII
jgi:hypothetical protein